MPRPKRPRKVGFLPKITYFKPRGVPLSEMEEVALGVDEIEAIRLVDLNNLDQTEAAKEMEVSQSTLQRILDGARKKIAEGLIKGKAIKIEGGEVAMPRFGWGASQGRGQGRRGGPFQAGPGGFCICVNPECKHEVAHLAGQPCYQQKCPKCGSPMIRKR